MLRVTRIVEEVYPFLAFLWEMDLLKEGRLSDDVLRRAADLGTIAHKCIQEGVLLPEAIADPNLVRMFGQYQKFQASTDIKFVEVEPTVYFIKEDMMFHGHLDLDARIDGEPWLIDIKTHGLYKDYDERETFKPINANKKAAVNLQTWLYSLTENGKYKDHKRGVLLINQYGCELIELKREPRQETQDAVFEFIKWHTNLVTF